jgi:hypothetical protein
MANAIRLDASADRLDTETVVPAGASWTSCGWVKIVADLNDETPCFTIEAIYGYPYIALRTDSDGVTPSVKLTWLSRAALSALTVGEWYFLGIRVQSSLAVSTWVGQAGGSLTRVDDTLSFGYSDPSIRYSIGGGYPGSGYLDGSFSRVRLWNAELSNAEMDAEFAQDVGAARTSGLVGDWFRPDVTLSTYLNDNSSSNNDLTTSGTHALDTTAPDLGATGSVATAAGASTAAAVGAALAAAAATAAGASSAAAVGGALAVAVASSTGGSTAAAVGRLSTGRVSSQDKRGVGGRVSRATVATAARRLLQLWVMGWRAVAAAGTSAATGSARHCEHRRELGAGAAAGVGSATVASVASASGSSTALAVGDWISGSGSVATSAGTSAAVAVGASLVGAVATASGTSTAAAVSPGAPGAGLVDTGFGRGGGLTCPRGIVGGGLSTCSW